MVDWIIDTNSEFLRIRHFGKIFRLYHHYTDVALTCPSFPGQMPYTTYSAQRCELPRLLPTKRPQAPVRNHIVGNRLIERQLHGDDSVPVQPETGQGDIPAETPRLRVPEDGPGDESLQHPGEGNRPDSAPEGVATQRPRRRAHVLVYRAPEQPGIPPRGVQDQVV